MDGSRHDGRILVVGMGRSGAAAAMTALRELPGVGVVVCDEKKEPLAAADVNALREAGALVELGRCDPGLLEGCGLVIKSPGVPRKNPLIEEALGRGIPVWGEVEFARKFLKNVIVGITGTNGKT
ncbi:MAG: UDP-N-acetylmuramoyl-L-alanine--D-glutamate ligase, partial [Actinomycetota bacterium]